MYESHFGLREPPFGITPDTSFAYACNSHQEALNTLLVAARNGEGFMKVTGEVGTGKTLLALAAGLKRTVSDREFRRLMVARPTAVLAVTDTLDNGGAERLGVLVLNTISASGLALLPAERYRVGTDISDPAAIHASCEDYRAAAGIDLANDPDIIKRDLTKSIEVAAAFWKTNGLNAYADQNDRDHAALRAAIDSGRIIAQEGV